MKKRSLLTFAVLLTLALPCFGDNENPVALKEAVRALENPFNAGKGSTIEDFKADFFQESRITSLDRVQNARGRVAVKFDPTSTDRRMTMFRWNYEQPAEQEVVSNGKTMWVYLPENRQVIQSKLDPSTPADDDPLAFLTSLGNLSRDFSISWASPKRDPEGNFVLKLQPKRPSAMIQNLLIAVDQQAIPNSKAGHDRSTAGEEIFPIISTTIVDPNGNSTVIEFRNPRTNRGIPDSFFDFTIPDGVEVVRPPEGGAGF